MEHLDNLYFGKDVANWNIAFWAIKIVQLFLKPIWQYLKTHATYNPEIPLLVIY